MSTNRHIFKTLSKVILAGAIVFSSAAYSATIVYDFSSAAGDLGASHVYTVGGISITATAFPVGATDHLYGKAAGGDENGLGLTNDPSGDHEISFGSFIQLDVSSLLASYNTLIIKMNSATAGETWNILQTNTAGSLAGASLILSGTDEVAHTISPNKTFLDFTVAKAGDNVLLGSLTAVPEPNSVVFVGAALGLVLLLRRRARA